MIRLRGGHRVGFDPIGSCLSLGKEKIWTQRKTHTHTQRMPCEHEGRNCSDSLQAKECQRLTANYQKPGEILLPNLQGEATLTIPCPWIAGPQTMTQYISGIYATPFVVLCYSSSRKLIHIGFLKVNFYSHTFFLLPPFLHNISKANKKYSCRVRVSLHFLLLQSWLF
jgi:hypothetical protein